jgi:uncharacterized protein (DUF1501 family)
MMKRREFLSEVMKRTALTIGGTTLAYVLPKQLGGVSSAVAQTTAAGVPAGSKRFIFIFCRGGFDTLAMFTPRDRTLLNGLRSATVIASTSNVIDVGLPYLPHVGLQPVFFDSTGKAFTDVAVVMQSGSLNDTRSHFQQQDYIESGSILQKTSQGFLSRLTQNIKAAGRPSLAVGVNVPFSLQGCDPSLLQSASAIEGGWTLKSIDQKSNIVSHATLDERLSMFSGSGTLNQDTILRQMSAAGKKDAVAIKAAYDSVVALQGVSKPASSTTFSNQIALASMMCRSSFNPTLTTLDYGSWDTHSAEGVNDGYFFSMATDLGKNLAQLRADLIREGEWNDTVVAVISEFGRTAVSNVAVGTDHGRGSAMLVMGGNVNRNHKDVNVAIDLANLDGTDGSQALQVNVDWRTVVGEILQKHLAVNVSGVFDQFTVDPTQFLNIIKS